MRVFDGFAYNFLAMGAIFPWVYLSGLAAFPKASAPWALVIGFLVEIPLCVAYSVLSASNPRNGGDYLFQRQAFGPIGAAVVLSGFVCWFLPWVAISGWLFADLGLGPMLLVFGYRLHSSALLAAGVTSESPGGVILLSLLLIAGAAYLMDLGIGRFARVQRVLFGLTIAALFAEVCVFLGGVRAFEHLSNFVQYLGLHTRVATLPELGTTPLCDLLISDTVHHSGDLASHITLFSTLAIVPIAWTSFQWATYSVEQNGVLEKSRSVRHQLYMTLGAATAVGFSMVLIGITEQYAVSSSGNGQAVLRAFAAAHDASGRFAAPSVTEFMTKIFQPFPNVVAMAASPSVWLAALIAIGFMANAFQVTCNCYVGASFLIRAMAEGGDLPRWAPLLRLESVRKSECNRCRIDPTRKHLHLGIYKLYALASVPITVAYNLFPSWSSFSVGITFACGYVFMMSGLAAFTLLRGVSNTSGTESDVRRAKLGAICGVVGGLVAFAMLCECLLVSRLQLNGSASLLYVCSVFVGSLGLVIASRRAQSNVNDRSRPTAMFRSHEPTYIQFDR